MELNLFDAEVIDIDDEDKKGKIKIRILPNLKDVKENDLPWAIPFSSINSTTTMSNDLPEVGSIIRVLVDINWIRYYYLSNRFFYDIFDFDGKVKPALDNATEISDKEYKNIVFRLYLDGGLEFHNNSDGSHGFIHKSGSYSIFDKDGYIILNDKDGNLYKTSSSGVNFEDKNGNTFVTSSTSVKINDNLEILK